MSACTMARLTLRVRSGQTSVTKTVSVMMLSRDSTHAQTGILVEVVFSND